MTAIRPHKTIKRQAILHQATELLAMNPAATLQDIANYAQIGIATLHRYFPSREILLDTLALHAIELIGQVFQKVKMHPLDAKTSLTQMIEALIPLGNKVYFLAKAASLDQNPDVIEAEHALRKPILQSIQTWQQNGLLRSDLSPTWMLTVINQLLFATWEEIQRGNLARNDASALLISTILQGFAPKSAK